MSTDWTSDKKSPSPNPPAAAGRGDDSAAATPFSTATPFCDEYCLKWFNTRLHSIDCDIANGRDPILPDRSVMRDAVRGTPYEEWE